MEKIKTIEILITIIVVYIAFQNHRIAKSKMRLDLYKQRFKIYNELQEFFKYIMIEGTVTSSVAGNLAHNTKEAVFLYDSFIVKYLKNMHSKAFELIALDRKLRDTSLPVGETRSKYACEMEALLNWFIKEHQKSANVFAEYLQIDKKIVDRVKDYIFPKDDKIK